MPQLAIALPLFCNIKLTLTLVLIVTEVDLYIVLMKTLHNPNVVVIVLNQPRKQSVCRNTSIAH